jgi:hypothetical protein
MNGYVSSWIGLRYFEHSPKQKRGQHFVLPSPYFTISRYGIISLRTADQPLGPFGPVAHTRQWSVPTGRLTVGV